MTQYNLQQVYQLLLNNGATQIEAATLAGLARWESGFNSSSLNPVAPDYSVGLFQYNFRAGVFNANNPGASTRGGYTASAMLASPDQQASAAIALLRSLGGNWSSTAGWRADVIHSAAITSDIANLVGSGTPGTPVPGGDSSGGSQSGGGGSSDGSSSGSSGGSSSGSNPATTFLTDVGSGFIGQISGPLVLTLGGVFVFLGFVMWKGAATVKVVNQGVKTSALAARALP